MKNKKLTCTKARDISIVLALEKLGHLPKRKTGDDSWFLSPIRSESKASFHVSVKKNRWYDHGLGKGGNIIDLIVLIKLCTVKEALEFLSGIYDSFSFQQQTFLSFPERRIEIMRINSISHPVLLKLLKDRCIPIKVAKEYCAEVWYQMNNKTYFSLGLQNQWGGWELRNKYFKNSSSPKSYSYFKKSSTRLLITEGMFDFLSLVTLEPDLVHSADTIVLNSIALIEDLKKIIPEYQKVLLYLDNDSAGNNATKKLIDQFPHITDCRSSYLGYKDLNERLTTAKKEKS